MPTTEVPNSPPPVQTPDPDPGLMPPRNNSSYGDLGTDGLVQRINELEDERRNARIREGIWVALLLHAIVVLLWIFLPRYLPHAPRVVNPMENQKTLTYVPLPPSELQRLRPRPKAPASDQNRVQSTPQPAPVPAPAAPAAPQAQQQAQQAPQQAQAAPQNAPAPQQQAQVQTPQPQNPPPRQQPQTTQQAASNPFKTPSSAGDMIRQAAHGASSGSSSAGGPAMMHGGMGIPGPEILSDTLGYDFDPYLKQLIAATYRAWLPIIPESARPPLNDKGKTYISFHIMPDGSVKGMRLDGPSGEVSLDRAAWAGIVGAGYPPLPKDFKGKELWLRFGFYYNIDPALDK